MNKIQFSTTKYDLVDNVNRTSTDFQATMVKGRHTLDSIIADAKANDSIKIYDENDEVIATYEGYNVFKAGSSYDNDGIAVISVELVNSDIESQINTLGETVSDLAEEQTAQGESINTLSSAVQTLDNSQAVQDLAIEDLGEAVSELVEE